MESYCQPLLPRPIKVSRPELPSGPKKISLTDDDPIAFSVLRHLRKGCYYTRWLQPTPNPQYTHIGTVRIEKNGDSIIASSDLYSHLNWRETFLPPRSSIPVRESFPEPNPSTEIPVFPREDYAFYLRFTEIIETRPVSNSFTFIFERYLYDSTNQRWTSNGEFRAEMSFDAEAPPEYPPGTIYLHGKIYDDANKWTGILTMGCISSYLRKATVEIDRSPESEAPLGNGSGVTWRSIFNDLDWDLTVDESDSNLVEPSGESWSMAELHAMMLRHRDSADLDSEWRYHLLCVRQLDFTSRGVMYDAYSWDFNNNPREGAAISSHWTIPNQVLWGDVAGKRFGAAIGPYFRTAVHEIGHAMGLYHNTIDNGIMNATNSIAASPGTFPRNIMWSFNSEDSHRLRHFPDPWVRPGMMRFGQPYTTVPIGPADNIRMSKMLSLDVKPLLSVVPIGAPVRVKVTLRNKTDATFMAPNSLSLKSGYVEGYVRTPSRVQNVFKSVAACIDQDGPKPLRPSDEIANDLTLIHGNESALFSETGMHKIEIRVKWKGNGAAHQVCGNTQVMIQPAKTDKHAEAALKILSTPEIMQTVAIGGDHLKDGLEALKVAMADEVLSSHYAVIEAKRLARPFLTRKAKPTAAIEVLRKGAIMSSSEARRVASLVGGALDTMTSSDEKLKRSEANEEKPEVVLRTLLQIS